MTQRPRHHSAGYVALLIVMAFLGHEFLMTGDVHARPDAAMEAAPAGHGHTAMPDSHTIDGQHTLASTSAPEHESGIDACSAMRHLVQRPGTVLHLNAELGAVAAAVCVEPPPPAVDHWWSEPTAPPDVVRALFQVFRI